MLDLICLNMNKLQRLACPFPVKQSTHSSSHDQLYNVSLYIHIKLWANPKPEDELTCFWDRTRCQGDLRSSLNWVVNSTLQNNSEVVWEHNSAIHQKTNWGKPSNWTNLIVLPRQSGRPNWICKTENNLNQIRTQWLAKKELWNENTPTHGSYHGLWGEEQIQIMTLPLNETKVLSGLVITQVYLIWNNQQMRNLCTAVFLSSCWDRETAQRPAVSHGCWIITVVIFWS